MIKATFKNIALSLAALALVIVVLTAVDGTKKSAVSSNTFLRVTVVDLDDKPVHNARVALGNEIYFTDNKGLSPAIALVAPQNSYDSAITDWYTVNVSVQREGYVATVVFNCVVYSKQTRKLTVRIYPKDSSNLPYVCYVESPPAEYIKGVLAK